MIRLAGQAHRAAWLLGAGEGNVTEVRLNGTKGLWVAGPQEIVYVRSDGTVVQASAGLTTGSTPIWRAAGRPAPRGRLQQGGRARGRRLRR